MIDAGEDVHHPHADEAEEARGLESAVLVADRERGVAGTDDLLNEISVGALDLGEIDVGRDQLEKRCVVEAETGRVRTGELELGTAETRRGGDRAGRRDGLARPPAGVDAEARRQIGEEPRVVGPVAGDPRRLAVGDTEGEVDDPAVDRPCAVRFAAGVRHRRRRPNREG